MPCLAFSHLPCLELPCLALPGIASPRISSTLPCLALPCLALPSPALSCPDLPCPVLPCPALPCLALPYPALPCPALSCPALPCMEENGSSVRLPNMLHAQQDMPMDIQETLTFPTLGEVAGQNCTGLVSNRTPHTFLSAILFPSSGQLHPFLLQKFMETQLWVSSPFSPLLAPTSFF